MAPDKANMAIRDGDFPLVYIAADGGLFKYFPASGEVAMMKKVDSAAGEQGLMVGYGALNKRGAATIELVCPGFTYSGTGGIWHHVPGVGWRWLHETNGLPPDDRYLVRNVAISPQNPNVWVAMVNGRSVGTNYQYNYDAASGQVWCRHASSSDGFPDERISPFYLSTDGGTTWAAVVVDLTAPALPGTAWDTAYMNRDSIAFSEATDPATGNPRWCAAGWLNRNGNTSNTPIYEDALLGPGDIFFRVLQTVGKPPDVLTANVPPIRRTATRVENGDIFGGRDGMTGFVALKDGGFLYSVTTQPGFELNHYRAKIEASGVFRFQTDLQYVPGTFGLSIQADSSAQPTSSGMIGTVYQRQDAFNIDEPGSIVSDDDSTVLEEYRMNDGYFGGRPAITTDGVYFGGRDGSTGISGSPTGTGLLYYRHVGGVFNPGDPTVTGDLTHVPEIPIDAKIGSVFSDRQTRTSIAIANLTRAITDPYHFWTWDGTTLTSIDGPVDPSGHAILFSRSEAPQALPLVRGRR